MYSRLWADKQPKNQHSLEKKVDGIDGEFFPTPIYLVCSEVDLNYWQPERK
jgi:hypothetical protein